MPQLHQVCVAAVLYGSGSDHRKTVLLGMSGEQPPRDGDNSNRPEKTRHRPDHDPFSSSGRLVSFDLLKCFGQNTGAIPKQILGYLREEFVR